MIKKYIQILFCLSLCFSSPVLSAVSADVDTHAITPQSLVVLTITSDAVSSSSPDLSVLKNLFNIVSTSVSRQSYVINGNAQTQMQWQFSLAPLQKGTVTIPSIVVGNERTDPIEINISDQAQGTSPQNPNPSKEQSTEPLYELTAELYQPRNESFVNEQILYAVRIFDSGVLESGEPSFEPTTDFIIKSLGKPKVKQTPDGKRVITYLFALFAQKSGDILIPKVVFDGYAYQKPALSNIFQGGIFQIDIPSVFGLQTPVHLEKEGKKINILPKPENYSSKWWLPAQNLSLSAKLVNPSQKILQGNVFMREITLTANGLTDSQLPELEFDMPSFVKTYPEKPVGETSVSDGGVVGQTTTLVSYIPQKTGQLVLPKIEIPWFNTLTNKNEVAVLEPEIITVFENPNIQSEKTDVPDRAGTTKIPLQKSSQSKPLNPYLISLVAFFAGLLFALILLKKPKEKQKAEPSVVRVEDIALHAKRNDLKALRNNLILWAQKSFPDTRISNLKDISDILEDKDFERMVSMLSAALYNKTKETAFQPKAFIKSFKKALKNKKKKKQTENLPIPPLY